MELVDAALHEVEARNGGAEHRAHGAEELQHAARLGKDVGDGAHAARAARPQSAYDGRSALRHLRCGSRALHDAICRARPLVALHQPIEGALLRRRAALTHDVRVQLVHELVVARPHVLRHLSAVVVEGAYELIDLLGSLRLLLVDLLLKAGERLPRLAGGIRLLLNRLGEFGGFENHGRAGAVAVDADAAA